MTNRRQFLSMGIAAAAWPGIMAGAGRFSNLAPAGDLARQPLYKAIYEKAYAPAVDFAAQMRRRGVAVHGIEQDITSVWFNDLELQWRRNPVAIAGLTTPEALFCLEQLAWNHRMRVVFQVTHERGPNGAIEHQVRAPQDFLRYFEDTLDSGLGWGASMAEMAIHSRPDRTPGIGNLTAGTRGGDAEGLPLVSWVIAPVVRT